MPDNSNNKVIDSPYLTGEPMSVFFTLTFANKLHLSCVDCQGHFLENGYPSHLKGNSSGGLKDVSFNYHCHFPSYSYVISVARDLSTFFASQNTQIVVEGDPNYLKKYESYMDEHKLRPKFSNKDNTRVTRPHVHGLINNIDVDNFTKSLEKSKYFTEYWQPGCNCFYPTIEKNNDWVYKAKYDLTMTHDITYLDPKFCGDPNLHLTPFKVRKSVGFYNIQKVRNNEATKKYIQKYIDKGGDDVQIF